MRSSSVHANGRHEATVQTAHSFTGRMCAASRWEETQRTDSLFQDHLAHRLAGSEGLASPMGLWILVPRTRYGDDYLRSHYSKGCRQLVLLGAGFDARAYRMDGLGDLRVFEVDQATTFDVKEPLLHGEPLKVASRATVSTEFSEGGRWARDLVAAGFDTSVPTVWLLEGLLMYLSAGDTATLMQDIGSLSASGSAVFHDAVSARYVSAGIVVRPCAPRRCCLPTARPARASGRVCRPPTLYALQVLEPSVHACACALLARRWAAPSSSAAATTMPASGPGTRVSRRVAPSTSTPLLSTVPTGACQSSAASPPKLRRRRVGGAMSCSLSRRPSSDYMYGACVDLHAGAWTWTWTCRDTGY